MEGEKMLKEALSQENYRIEEIFITSKNDVAGIEFPSDINISEITINELEQISSLKTPNKALMVLKQPVRPELDSSVFRDVVLYLDRIQDPGNMGTIMRTADWFGINHIFCSEDCAELYNPKVLQASMGSVFRVNVWNISFEDEILPYIKSLQLPVYGTFLEGENIYKQTLKAPCIMVLGNESKGISAEMDPYISEKIHIPSFAQSHSHSESLNVAVTAGIVCSELRRKIIHKP
ncbi:MAG: RNA methyltransferase [Bacteroidetes bacterium]|nr:RNA methyltransferase [Bacteroidota bacterium]